MPEAIHYTVEPFTPGANESKPHIRQQLTTTTAAELRTKRFPDMRYVVPGFIAEGCTLLAGRPKLGKSWLALEVALAVASGGECLGGIPCEQGDVLYLALEDNERRLQRRIDKVLGAFAPEWPAALDLATEWPRANEGGIEAIREWVLAHERPRLVIVDVLAMFKPARGDKESLYEADYHAIKGLQALAGEFGIAVVIIHHTRKSGSEVDPFEKVSGTLGLSGAADATMILDQDGQGATLYGRGRDVEEVEAAVKFDRDACRWVVLGEAGEVRRTDERRTILDALRGAEEPMSPRDIMAAAGLTNRNALDLLLSRMSRAGEVTKAARGRYTLPGQIAPPRQIGQKDRSEDGDESADAYRRARDGAAVIPQPTCQSFHLSDLSGGCDLSGGERSPDLAPTSPKASHIERAAPLGLVGADGTGTEALAAAQAGASKPDPVRTLVPHERWRLDSKRNTEIVTAFNVSAISRGVKALAGPLVSMKDGPSAQWERFVEATLLRSGGLGSTAGGGWPYWLLVIEGKHDLAPFPTDPGAFDAWFPAWAQENGVRVIGDWREEARAEGALDWLKQEGEGHA